MALNVLKNKLGDILNPIIPRYERLLKYAKENTERFTGEYFGDGKKIYEQYVVSTVGSIQTKMNSIGIDTLINHSGWARCNNNIWWPYPNTGEENVYSSFFYRSTNNDSFICSFRTNYNSSNEVKIYLKYTKK